MPIISLLFYLGFEAHKLGFWDRQAVVTFYLRLSTSALADLPGSGSTGQLVYFGLTQICGNTCIQVLAPTGQVPVKSQVLVQVYQVDLDYPNICKYSQVLPIVYF